MTVKAVDIGEEHLSKADAGDLESIRTVADERPVLPDKQQSSSATIHTIACCLVFMTAILALYTLYVARNLFIPIAVALFAYLTLRPTVAGLRKWRVPAPLSATGILLLLVASIGFGVYMVAGPLEAVVKEMPRSVAEVKRKLAFVLDQVETVNEATQDLSDAAEDQMEPAEERPVPVEIKQPAWTRSSPLIAGTGNFLSQASISAVLLFFLLASGDQFVTNLLSALPSIRRKRQLIEVIRNTETALSSYLACVTTINIGLGVCIGLIMWCYGMPNPLAWAVAAALLNYIPIIGALVGIAAAFLVALITLDGLTMACIVSLSYAVFTTLEGQFITPAVLGRSMKLSSLMVFVFIVIWGWMWGLAGIFLAVPILIAIAMMCEKLEPLRPLSKVLSGNVPAVEGS